VSMSVRNSHTTKADGDKPMYSCPKCGEETPELHEGYCEPCCADGQRALDEHNARHDWWNRLSDSERSDQIKRAMQSTVKAETMMTIKKF
jgi:hypothetical protein